MRFLRFSEGLGGMLHGLAGLLVRRLMIFLVVMCGGSQMCVRGHLVKFCSSPM